MTHVGCAAWLFLLVVLAILGITAGTRQGTGAAIGLAFGATAWLAVMTAYLCALSIVDRRRMRTKPDLIGVPRGVVPAIWVAFACTAAAAVWLAGRVW